MTTIKFKTSVLIGGGALLTTDLIREGFYLLNNSETYNQIQQLLPDGLTKQLIKQLPKNFKFIPPITYFQSKQPEKQGNNNHINFNIKKTNTKLHHSITNPKLSNKKTPQINITKILTPNKKTNEKKTINNNLIT